MKTTGRPIKRVTKLAGAFVRQMGGEPGATHFVDLPPAPNWFARGPRGGIYVAVGERERAIGVDADDFMRDLYSVLDRSEDSRYVRPGTKLHAEATEALR